MGDYSLSFNLGVHWKEPHSDNLAQVHHLASEYAFHVIEQGLAGKSDSQAQFEQVSNWKNGVDSSNRSSENSM